MLLVNVGQTKKPLSLCEKGFVVICYYYFCFLFRYMRQAFSHRNSGMIMEIIIKPSSRIYPLGLTF